MTQPTPRRADEVARLASAPEGEVGLAHHAAVHDQDAFGHAVFFSIAVTISSTVVTSARLPKNTSKESRKPSGVQIRPMHTCLQSGRWSRE